MAALVFAAATPCRALTLDYEADASCPSHDAFVDQLKERLTAARAVSGQVQLAIRIERNEDGELEGHLAIQDSSGVSQRTVTAPECGEVVAALALVSALALEKESAPPPKHIAEAAPVAPSDGWMPMHEPGPDYDPYRAALGPSAARSWWGLGMHVGTESGVLPTTVFAPRLFVDARIEGTGVWSPSARLSAVRAVDHTRVADGSTRSMYWTSGRADMCPANIQLSHTVGLLPCGFFEAGVIDARDVSGFKDPNFYAALGGLGRLQLIGWDILMLELEGGVGVPVAHPEIIRGYHASAPITAFAGLGMGARFP